MRAKHKKVVFFIHVQVNFKNAPIIQLKLEMYVMSKRNIRQAKYISHVLLSNIDLSDLMFRRDTAIGLIFDILVEASTTRKTGNVDQ